jgi:methionine-gamma-lyase
MARSFDTRAIHEGETPRKGSLITPIYQTATFAFETLDEGKEAIEISLDKNEPGYAYTRFSNPTHFALEKKMASLEGGEAALSTASGMAAISTAAFAMLKKGDHLISARGVYTASYSLFSKLPNWGIEVSFIDQTKTGEIDAHVKKNTKLIFLESPSNPLLDVADIGETVKIAKKAGAKVMIDNTFATPYYQRPIELGADIVVHSATKYLNGHLDTMGGIIISTKVTIQSCSETLTLMGGIMNPFNAWLILRGIRTLHVRMDRHSQNALKIAEWLESQPMIKKVFYPGLASNPQQKLALKQMGGSGGGMVSFEVAGGLKGAQKVLENVKICSLAVSLGGPETLLEHPATMSHQKYPLNEREALGITDGVIRMSVGLENADDIIGDLTGALKKV